MAEPRYRKAALVEVVRPDAPLKAQLVGYFWRLTGVTIFVGALAGLFVYAGIGAGLGHIFAQGGPVTLETLFSPRIYLPIIGMGVLAFLPPLWRHWRNRRGAAPLDEK